MLLDLIYPPYSRIARKASTKSLTAAVTTIDDGASGSVCSAMKSGGIVDVEDLHRNAILDKRKSYTDPPTGFTVFTELAHLKRGVCCGNMCRHCPYGWANVRGAEGTGVNGPSPAQVRAVRSGDVVETGRLVRRIMDGTYYDDEDSLDLVETSSNEPDESNSSRQQQLPTAVKGGGGRAGGTLTAKNVPYTRSGDMGVSQLFTGERRSKDDILFEAMGTVDELCSTVGVVYALIIETSGEGDVNFGELPLQLLDVMSRLFDVGSHIARPTLSTLPSSKSKKERFNAQHVDILEQWIDNMTEQLPELTSFILPTGGVASAQLHLARTVCRRAERRMVPIIQDEDGSLDLAAYSYINRLSDYLFTVARYVNYCEGKDEVQYRKENTCLGVSSSSIEGRERVVIKLNK